LHLTSQKKGTPEKCGYCWPVGNGYRYKKWKISIILQM